MRKRVNPTHCKHGHPLIGDNVIVRKDRRNCIECRLCRLEGRRLFKLKNPLYDVWQMMHRRCTDPNFKDWKLYGGREPHPVTVCDRWKTLDAFVADMTPRPSPQHTLDRIDGARGYSPDNCRWSTPKAQARNVSDNRLIEYGGVTLTLAEWAEKSGLKYMTFFARLNRGWSFEKALLTPKIENEDIDHSYIKRDRVTGRLV